MNINNITSNWQQLWLYQPSVLVTNIAFWPSYQMSTVEQLNSLTRLLILIFIILYFLDYKDLALYILIIGIMLIIFTSLIVQSGDNNTNIIKQNTVATINGLNGFNKLTQSVPVISHLQVYDKTTVNDQRWKNLRCYNKY